MHQAWCDGGGAARHCEPVGRASGGRHPHRAVRDRRGRADGTAARRAGRHDGAAAAAHPERAAGQRGSCPVRLLRGGGGGLGHARRGARLRLGRADSAGRVRAASNLSRARSHALHVDAVGPLGGDSIGAVLGGRAHPRDRLGRLLRPPVGRDDRDAARDPQGAPRLGARGGVVAVRQVHRFGRQGWAGRALAGGRAILPDQGHRRAQEVGQRPGVGAVPLGWRRRLQARLRLQGRDGPAVGARGRAVRRHALRARQLGHLPALGRRGALVLGLAGPDRQGLGAG
mmetsp:Transcript_51041/g.169061  ORF Transcript_51041/g.169061 Transcript_51041/m.169061 type:complete len:285 (+) Transcript_51041:229-1083(+)